ncbi:MULTISPECIES: hypothetical protein [Planktothricoides]|uniref:Uncharacterized protein n=1 Tax=Planktothricoides raciborskii GIHE-MW2 TaxID=2792601 RepID=A0AAU8JLM6_9CYAN|nr:MULTISPECIES: hypothetical protein [Planktothricoides]
MGIATVTTAAGTVGAVAISSFVAVAAPLLAVGTAGALVWWLARD